MSVEINKDMLYPSLLYNKPVKYDDYITLYPVTMNDVIMFNLLSQSITVRKNSTFRDKKIIKMIRMYYYVNIDSIKEIRIDDETKNTINKYLDLYYDRYTGLYLNSKDFLKKIM